MSLADGINLQKVGKFLKKELRAEIRAQKRIATKGLINSIDFTVDRFLSGGLVVNYFADKSWVYSEFGVRASKVPFSGSGGNRSTGAKKSKYIEALKNWIKVKGIESNDKKVTGMAFAIAHTQKKEGIPTKRSISLAGGRKLGYQNYVLNTNENMIYSLMEDATQTGIEKEFGKLLSKLVA
jgi:hypothetical protein